MDAATWILMVRWVATQVTVILEAAAAERWELIARPRYSGAFERLTLQRDGEVLVIEVIARDMPSEPRRSNLVDYRLDREDSDTAEDLRAICARLAEKSWAEIEREISELKARGKVTFLDLV